MNTRMMGRSQGGFTTCFILHARPDGTVTIANASHLAPYVNGEEMKTENGLPLGLAADTDYAESNSALAPGSNAHSPHRRRHRIPRRRGRTVRLRAHAGYLNPIAESIAHAAQAFGQEDDITVLTLTLAPAEVLHA